MSFKTTLKIIGVTALSLATIFFIMVTQPQILPYSWSTTTNNPVKLSPEEIDASCCEVVKLGKWKCDDSDQHVNSTETIISHDRR